MNDDRSTVHKLVADAWELPEGLARTNAMARAVDEADRLGDVQLSFDTRKQLVNVANFGGSVDVSLTAFIWCLAQCDRDPKRFPESEMLWEYKWIVNDLAEFPTISRARIEAALDDLEMRYERSGWGRRGPRMKRCSAARTLGDLERLPDLMAQWLEVRRDRGADCRACEQDAKVGFAFELGDHRKAVSAAKPLLEGRQSCSHVPHITLAKVLRPMLKLGMHEEAVEAHLRGLPLVARGDGFLVPVAEHVEFLALTGNYAKAATLWARHVGKAMAAPNTLLRLRYLLGGRVLVLALRRAGREERSLRIPAGLPFHEPSGRYNLARLDGWLENEINGLARAFDARNGNDWYARLAAGLPSLLELSVRLPLEP